MGSSTNLEVEAEVRVWDTEKSSRGDRKDEYNIVVRDGQLFASFRFWEESRPVEIWIRSEQVDPEDIPDNVASAMQEYMDDSIVPWPETFGSRQGEVDREEATVDITQYEDEDDEDGIRYRFKMWSRDYVDLFRDGERIDQNQVPPDVVDEAEEYIPTGVDYFLPR